MAEIFLAKSRVAGLSDRLLALKRTLPQLSSDVDFVAMFTDEVRIARSLQHPNICQIYDAGMVNDQHFIAMEYVHGKDLKVVAKRAKERGEVMPQRHIAFILARI